MEERREYFGFKCLRCGEQRVYIDDKQIYKCDFCGFEEDTLY